MPGRVPKPITFKTPFIFFLCSLVAQRIKHLPAMRETRVRSLGWEDRLEKEMATHSSILAWRIHGQRSLAGYSPRGPKELDTTERVHVSRFIFFTTLILQMRKLRHRLSLGEGHAKLGSVRTEISTQAPSKRLSGD